MSARSEGRGGFVGSYRRRLATAALAGAMAAMAAWAAQAPAATFTWVGGSGDPNNWNNAQNWSPNTAIPGAGDVADFNTPSSQPALTADSTIGMVEFDTSG